MSLEDREKFKQSLIARRVTLDSLLMRMQAAGWFTADPVFLSVEAAQKSLHAAIHHIGQLPPEVRPPIPPPACWKAPYCNGVSPPLLSGHPKAEE